MTDHRKAMQAALEAMTSHPDNSRRSFRAAIEALRAALAQPEQQVVSDAMVEAANDAYWRRTDELPQKPDKWRNGTPYEATRVSLIAALKAAQPQQEPTPASPEDMKVYDAIAANYHKSQPQQEPKDDTARDTWPTP